MSKTASLASATGMAGAAKAAPLSWPKKENELMFTTVYVQVEFRMFDANSDRASVLGGPLYFQAEDLGDLLLIYLLYACPNSAHFFSR